MKLLVTGGAGFIGSNFIRFWLKKHPRDFITNLDKLTYASNLKSLAEVEKNPHYRFVKGDICDPKIVKKAIQGTDFLVHFAAESHVDRSISGPAVFVKTNVLGTQVLLDAAIRASVKRFHHVSTDEVFGSLPLHSKKKFNEKTPYDPRSPYAASKAASDHLVRAFFHTFGLPITITNCSNNFGPYAHPEKFIPLVITNILKNKKVPIYGDGLYVRDWLYVKDHCRAIEAVLEKGKVGETYCVGGQTKEMNNLTLVKNILRLMGKDEDLIEFVKDRPGHDRKYAVDWSKIQQELSWRPQHDFNHYLKKTIQWYQDNRWWWERGFK
jgi:dTDP-glucose 4,6-dehydratase